MSNSHRRNLSLLIRRILRQPLSITMLTIGLLASVLFQSLFIFGAAIASVVIYTIIKLQDEDFIRSTIQEAHGRRSQADLMQRTFRIEELDVESRLKMKMIVKLQNEISSDILNARLDELSAGLDDTIKQTEDLVDRGLLIAQKRRELQKYLKHTDKCKIESRIETLQNNIKIETDPAKRAVLETSLKSTQQELVDYNAIEATSTGILYQLESIETAFSSLRAKIIKIRSTDIDEWTAANTELKTQLGGLNNSVDTLEQSIQEVLSTRSNGF